MVAAQVDQVDKQLTVPVTQRDVDAGRTPGPGQAGAGETVQQLAQQGADSRVMGLGVGGENRAKDARRHPFAGRASGYGTAAGQLCGAAGVPGQQQGGDHLGLPVSGPDLAMAQTEPGPTGMRSCISK